MPLADAADGYAGRQLLIGPDRGAEWACRSFWEAPGPVDFDAPVAAKADPVEVYANEGRWIAECPDCRGAQLACRTDLRFMCHCCGNASLGGRWRPVVWPQRAAVIEAVLETRHPLNQNWTTGELVVDLVEENLTAGVAIPAGLPASDIPVDEPPPTDDPLPVIGGLIKGGRS